MKFIFIIFVIPNQYLLFLNQFISVSAYHFTLQDSALRLLIMNMLLSGLGAQGLYLQLHNQNRFFL